MTSLKIGFDSLSLATIVEELQTLVGGKIQRIVQPNDHDLYLAIYAEGREQWLLISVHPQYARAHLSVRTRSVDSPPAFCQYLRAHLEGGRIDFIRQGGFDRILEIGIFVPAGAHIMVAELMGKHAIMMLVDADARIVAANQWVGPKKSHRPVTPGTKYARPFKPKPPISEMQEGEDPKAFEGASPTLLWLLQKLPIDQILAEKRPHLFPGRGAYPFDLDGTGIPKPTMSVALEGHFSTQIPTDEAQQQTRQLLVQLRRVLLARETALSDLAQVADAAARAREIQTAGELILAYQSQIQPGDTETEVWDYEGQARSLLLVPDLTPTENAQRYFDKAKKAKARSGFVTEQIARLSEDRTAILNAILRLESDPSPAEVRAVKDIAEQSKWLFHQPAPMLAKEDRPYQGLRVRELLAPGGWKVLYGENAEANDYLTLRVAKPNDWWLHVRGHTSAHVIVVTSNQPDKVPQSVLQFAAQVAVRNSSNKHSSYVPVDVTLKKYVRRPKGGAKGTVLYSHEKTIHVEGS